MFWLLEGIGVLFVFGSGIKIGGYCYIDVLVCGLIFLFEKVSGENIFCFDFLSYISYL